MKKNIVIGIIFLIIFAVIVLYLVMENTGEQNIAGERTSVADIATKDSNNNGIPDWKEDLLGDQIEKKYFESRTRPRRTAVNTRTQEIIAKAFERGEVLEKSGSLNEETAAVLADDLLSQFGDVDELTRNIIVPTVIDDETEEVKIQFLTSFTEAFLPLTELKENELQVLKAALDKTPGSTQKLQELVLAYESVYNSLAEISVPRIIYEDYLELYTIFSVYYRAFELFLNVQDSQSHILLLTVVQQVTVKDENGRTRIDVLSQNIFDTLQK